MFCFPMFMFRSVSALYRSHIAFQGKFLEKMVAKESQHGFLETNL